jgi:hypothetical protein
VVFEWWNGPKMLTIYVSPEETFYTKSSEDDPLSMSEEGDAASATSRRQLWAWLTT